MLSTFSWPYSILDEAVNLFKKFKNSKIDALKMEKLEKKLMKKEKYIWNKFMSNNLWKP